MKIQNYSVQQNALHRLEKSRDATESLTVWTSGAHINYDDESPFILDIRQQAYDYTATAKTSNANQDDSDNVQDPKTETKLRLIEALVYQMTGKRIKLQAKNMQLDSTAGQPVLPREAPSPVQERDGWGLIYEYQETLSENESMRFNSGGTVTTSDGRKITFSLEFNMSRSYYQQSNVGIRMGDSAKADPLVVVMDDGTPTLSRNRVLFDLDSDGHNDNIAFATGNSGFLALDRNCDGKINDGSELFGPQSGNGFSELRAFDLDKNDWIDESDEVFSRLSMLSVSENGEKTLVQLADVGIGAIYLNEISSSFEIKDMTDEYGEIRSSSIYLRENGTAGTTHHIDLSL